MSATQAPDLARLEEYRGLFQKSAIEFPNLNAIVVFRPDLRRKEAEREAQKFHAKPPDSAPEILDSVLPEQTGDPYAAMRSAVVWESWVPESTGNIEQLGYQSYWTRVLGAGEFPEFCGPPTGGDAWLCTLFGPPIRDVDNPALARFYMLAADAAHLILPRSKAEGKALLSHWLIHLANRPEPIVPDSRRRYLAWRPLGGVQMPPMWVPVTPQNSPSDWWAARLSNVLWLSRAAVEEALDVAAGAPAPTPAAALPSQGRLREPSKEAIAVYRYQLLTGKTQTELAADPELMKQLRRKVDQGTISRWLTKVKRWIKAGGVLPPLPEAHVLKPKPMDPERIDMGERLDGRAKHQRSRRNSDHDD